MKSILTIAVSASLLSISAASGADLVINPTEDVMTSPFFTGTDLVRGYIGDNRPTFRVSSINPFGQTGAEAIYLSFTGFDFSTFTQRVEHATLTLTSVAGGFSADASAASPFLVSAHGVNANPFTSITDNTNPSGAISYQDFFNNNILAADGAARTSINGFGQFSFDVTSIVNSWVAGTNANQFIAMTGKNDTSGTDFLHGFSNSSNTAQQSEVSYLTVTTVPEPGSALLLGLGGVLFGVRRRRG